MPQNTLFNFLTYRNGKENTPFKHAMSVTLKKTAESKNYFLISLPQIKCTIAGMNKLFKLTQHHISVYQFESKDQSQLSQLHYTAEFVDEEKNEYRLHVYYDHKDQVVSGPQFCKKTGDKKSITTTKMNPELLELAETSISNIIVEIREQHLREYNSVERQYRDLDEKFSLYFDKQNVNRDDYLSLLEQLIEATHSMTLLTSHLYYSRQHRFLMRMLEMGLQRYSTPRKESLQSPDQMMSFPAVKTTHTPTKRAKEKAPSTNKTKEKTDQKKTLAYLNNLKTKINILEGKFSDLLESSDKITKKYARELGDIWSYCNEYLLEIELSLEDLRSADSLECLDKLEKLSSRVEKTCQHHFLQLLAKNEFAQTKDLQAFYYLLDINIVCSALQQDNVEMLDFALTHIDDLALGNQVLIINNKRYNSAVSYCYQHGLAGCLAVLVRHNASLLTPDENGIPIAYYLLQPNHPLGRVLAEAYPDKKITSYNFYLRCKNMLQRFLKTHELPAKQCQEINAVITLLEATLHDLAFYQKFYPFKIYAENSLCGACILLHTPLPLDYLKVKTIQTIYFQCFDTISKSIEKLLPVAKENILNTFIKLKNIDELFHLNNVDRNNLDVQIKFLAEYISDATRVWENFIENVLDFNRSKQKVIDSTLIEFEDFYVKYKFASRDIQVTKRGDENKQKSVTTSTRNQAPGLPFFATHSAQKKPVDAKLEDAVGNQDHKDYVISSPQISSN